ncbi:MAG TPA: hemolysin family protein [Chloroflexia bacterium]|nr:hemolysin family protein [Chloroflexia bacterium]
MLSGDGSSSLPALFAVAEEAGAQATGFDLSTALGLIAVVVLVLLNGFFVATEFALVAVRRSRIEQRVAEGNKAAVRVSNALDHLDTYIAATQLGITMASLALGWLGEPALAHLIEPVLSAVLPGEWAVAGSHAVAVAIAFALITTLHIVLGELAPKGLALQQPEATSLAVALPVSIFLKIFRPFITVLNGTGNLVLRLMGLQAGGGEESVHSVEELRYLVRASRVAGVLDEAEEEIAGRALTLGDVHAHNVMVPRTEMVSVRVDIGYEELLELAADERHVRFPVYEETNDRITGVIYITDVLVWHKKHPGEPFDVRKAMRRPLFVPESIKGDALLAQMRAAKVHMAIAVDEFGGVAGLVTLQDLVEHIVGDIPEEGEDEQPEIVTLPDGSIRIDGMAALADVREQLALDLNGIEADTMGGYVLNTLGRVPTEGELLALPDCSVLVAEMDGTRVASVVLTRA